MRTFLLVAIVAVTSLSSCRKCIDPPVNEPCMDIYDPVCANGITYGNECEAKRAGETSWVKGACEK